MAHKSRMDNIKALKMCVVDKSHAQEIDCTKCPYVEYADDLGNSEYDCKDIVMLDALEFLQQKSNF